MRRAALLALVAGTFLAAAAAARAASAPTLIQGNASFPDRAFVLTTSDQVQLTAGDVVLEENGQRVRDLTLVPAQAASQGKFGVILVLDASQSMLGDPIAGAVGAARAFAQQRAPNEQLGVVTFNIRPATVLAPTVDGGRIGTALAAKPRLAYGTYIYDAAGAALALLRKTRVNAGSIVVLSDGADTGSHLRLAELTARARAAHVRIFTVGLRSEQFRAGTLRRLARETGAQYAEASNPAALVPIYRALSEQLSNEYLLQYRSAAAPGLLVRVRASVHGLGVTTAQYRTPGLPANVLRPFHRSAWQRFWLSSGSAVVISLLIGLVAALGLLVILRSGPYPLRERMTSFISSARGELRTQPQAKASQSLVALDRALSRWDWWGRFKTEAEIGEFPMPPAKLAALTIFGTVVLAFFIGVLLPPVFILLALGVPVAARALVKRKLRERRQQFAEQLPDNLTVLASALRAGHSFIGALSVMVDESDEPARSEFRRAVADEQLGAPIEDTLITVAQRMASDDLEQVALVAALQRQTGGNTAEVLDTVVDTIRERAELRRLVRTLTAQGRISRLVLTGLPVLLALIITAINPGYVHPLYHTGTGQALLVLAIVMLVAGSAVIQRIIDIKV